MSFSALIRTASELSFKAGIAVSILFFLTLFTAPVTSAYSGSSTYGHTNYELNLDNDVPRNQQTYVQSTIIEILSSFTCILVGENPVNPQQKCLDVNTQTGKLGYIQKEKDAPLGGLIGQTTNMIGMLYTPTTSSSLYFQDLADNFGIVQKTHAQAAAVPLKAYDGFTGLQPILPIWRNVLNIAYLLLALIFMIIGIGIMLRIKIDARTVMTLQNQIPRIIISIILITFSYAFAALLIDLMWTMTFVGVNQLTTIENPKVDNDKTLSQKATNSLMQNPIIYANDIYDVDTKIELGGGIGNLAWHTSQGFGNLIKRIVNNILNTDNNKCVHGLLPPKVDPGACVAGLIGGVATFIFIIVIFIAILITLFKVWWMLLKAYLYTIMYVILAPVWIIFGLLPGRPLGFEKWIRSLFVNLAVYPLVVYLFVVARVLMEKFKEDPQNKYIPPLVGNPDMEQFGVLLAFGAVLMTPTLIDWLRDAMNVKGSPYGKNIGAALSQGASVPGAVAAASWKNLTERDPNTGAPIGVVSRLGEQLGHRISKGEGAMSRMVPLAVRRRMEFNRQWHNTPSYEHTSTRRDILRKQIKGESLSDEELTSLRGKEFNNDQEKTTFANRLKSDSVTKSSFYNPKNLFRRWRRKA